MAEVFDISRKVYDAEDVQKLLGLGRTKTYEFLDEVYQKQEPFRVIRIGKVYRIPCKPFEQWLMGEQFEWGAYMKKENSSGKTGQIKEKRVAFFENNSWYHRYKELQDDMTIKYSKKGGFETPEEAEESYWKYEKRFKEKQREFQMAYMKNADIMFGDYLKYWFEHIYSIRIETTTKMIGSYVLYELIIPSMENDIKLRYVSVEYLDSLFQKASKICPSAGNKSRELVSLAMKDAMFDGFITYNPVPETKPYKRKKPKIRILSKEKIKELLEEMQVLVNCEDRS